MKVSQNGGDILELVKLFFSKECSESFLKKIVEKFAKIDNTFADDQRKEISILSGIILSRMCESERINDIFCIAVYIKSLFPLE